ncbi:hypothetical protein jhhlp_007275 [Lomentospora prolificans]|uniref:Uncharacterized protein n=1 Tax=Lomentospora prolificans TaxID=41688 RepID=A0A2N3N277_9PEZI|nr:hypothetical protein jhhlp_007275 [Lomentospora prolificans]
MTTNLITIDNYKEELSGWSPESPNQLFAIVDMGSNGIRFTITDLSPPFTRLLRCVYRERAGISLFDALSASGSSTSSDLKFPTETIRLVSETLARFRRIADGYGVAPENFSVLATEAMRRASNAADMLDAIREQAGVGVHILAPEIETMFGAVMGSRSSFVNINRGALFLDLGGGSVQMTWVDTKLPEYEIEAALAGVSLPFGAARLIRVLEGDAKVASTEKAKLRDGMRKAFEKLSETFPSLRDGLKSGEGVDVYLCGGGFRGYGSMLMHNDPVQPYPIPSVGAYTVAGEFFRQTKRMQEINERFDGKIFGLSKRRRQQFPAILEVLDALVNVVPAIRTATFCTGSNRDGALLMKLPREIRESDPLEALANVGAEDKPIIDAVTATLRGSIPDGQDLSLVPTIFSLGLAPLFIQRIWHRMGEDVYSNAANALHEAVTRDPKAPGLTHLARAVLGLTVAARWGYSLGPIDAELYTGLKGVLDEAHGTASFWAEYFGVVADILSMIIPCQPRKVEDITSTIKVSAALDTSGKKDKIRLELQIAHDALKGVDTEVVKQMVEEIGKQKGRKCAIKIRAEISGV